MQHTPNLKAPFGQAMMIVMQAGENAVSAFDGRGRPLKCAHPLRRPILPLFKEVRIELLGDGVGHKPGLERLQSLPDLGLLTSATRLSQLSLPIHHGQSALLNPALPKGRKRKAIQILPDTGPPKIHQRCQVRQLFEHLGHRVLARR